MPMIANHRFQITPLLISRNAKPTAGGPGDAGWRVLRGRSGVRAATETHGHRRAGMPGSTSNAASSRFSQAEAG